MTPSTGFNFLIDQVFVINCLQLLGGDWTVEGRDRGEGGLGWAGRKAADRRVGGMQMGRRALEGAVSASKVEVLSPLASTSSS